MSDKLGKYLTSQRDDFDVEALDDNLLWKKIQDELHPGKQVSKHLITKTILIKFRNIAAVVIILFSLGYIANDILNGRIVRGRAGLSSVDSELGRRENEYMSLVRFKTEEVSSFSGSSDVNIKQLFAEIKKLDTIYDQSMADLKELGPNEKVINTIFNTYEQKIRLLELIILETNKINNHESNRKINL
jgi:hypothetical protein